MSRNPDGSVLALSSATDEAMEGFKWHQPPAQPQPPHETTTATALVSLTPVAPVSQASRSGHHPQAPQNNNQDVINLQYMELEEFLLENAVAVTVPEHKAYQPLHDDSQQQPQHHSHPNQQQQQQQPHPVSLEQRPPAAGYPAPSLANNVLQIMSSATTPSEVKREQDGDETVVVDPLLHRSNGGGTNSNHPMTPPDHQNDVIMKVGRSLGRTMSGPANGEVPPTLLTQSLSNRRTNSLCEPTTMPHHPNTILSHHQQNNTDHHGGHHGAPHHLHGNISPPAANVVLAVNTSPNRNGDGGMDNCLALSPSSSASSSSSSDCGSSGGNARVTRQGAAAGGRSSRVALAMQSSVVAAAAAATSPRGSSSRRLKKEPVPEASKDDKYWKRRAKNNAAAKRSRDLRREKENSILQRVQFLEGQNQILNQTLVDMKQENADLKERLARYEAV